MSTGDSQVHTSSSPFRSTLLTRLQLRKQAPWMPDVDKVDALVHVGSDWEQVRSKFNHYDVVPRAHGLSVS
eukprot:167982-Hanusia_phi.AAC.1